MKSRIVAIFCAVLAIAGTIILSDMKMGEPKDAKPNAEVQTLEFVNTSTLEPSDIN